MDKKFRAKKLFLVVPKIIEQPTWGGNYILGLKKWRNKEPYRGLKIGQSYEFYSGSFLRGDLTSSANPDFTGLLGRADRPDKEIYQSDRKKLIKLENVIEKDPVNVLGKTAARKGQGKLNLLIKFTQAKDNSFQLHIRPNTKSAKWRPKPESWYYFRTGLVTLGLKQGADVKQYRQAMIAVDRELSKLSARVTGGKLKLADAKKDAAAVVEKYDPWRFVNMLRVNADEVVDLSEGGLHHSWEDDPRRLPLGNILYELQLDVMDPVSTLRCFDKGKFKSDGTLRKLQIEEYFKYLNPDPAYNRPAAHRQKPKLVFSNQSIRVESVMSNPYYCLDKIILKNEYAGPHTAAGSSFHHLFVQSGTARITTGKESLELTAGHSAFITATAGSYKIKSGRIKTEILKSYIA